MLTISPKASDWQSEASELAVRSDGLKKMFEEAISVFISTQPNSAKPIRCPFVDAAYDIVIVNAMLCLLDAGFQGAETISYGKKIPLWLFGLLY
jgi:hypothetical protein